MKLNNKGFAVTTILYGTLILFLLLLVSMLGILSTYMQRTELLIEKANGVREIVTMRPKNIVVGGKATERWFYCITASAETTTCSCSKYLSKGGQAEC